MTYIGTDDVADPFASDTSCTYIKCRKNTVTVNYGLAKSNLLNIKGVPFLAGYNMFDLPLDLW